MPHVAPDVRFYARPTDGPVYRRWLDGLRGVAILTVVAFHFNWLMGGFLGVDVFFVLSGFLITTILVEEFRRSGSISLTRFYLGRALRLLPAFWVLLLVCGGWAWTRPAEELPSRQKEIGLAACYVSNWPALHHTSMPRLCHTWSLSVEEQFYVVWPLLLYALLKLRLPPGWILGLVCVGIAASSVGRAVLYALRPPGDPSWGENVRRLYEGLDTRADALLTGCLVGLLAAWDLLPKSRAFVSGTGAAALFSAGGLLYLLIFARYEHASLYLGGFALVPLLVAVILVRLLVAPCRSATAVLESSILVGAGRISYALYLFHWPIRIWLRSETPAWAAFAPNLIAVCLTLAAAVASYFAIERPCLRLKRRLRRQAPIAPLPESRGITQAA